MQSGNPHQEKPFHQKWWFIAIIIIVLIGLLRDPEEEQSNNTTTGNTAPDNSETVVDEDYLQRYGDFILKEINTETDALDNLRLKGVIKNISNEDKQYVEINFKLFNEQNEVLGTAMDNITDLSGGETWRFEAIGIEDEAVEYEVVSIDGR